MSETAQIITSISGLVAAIGALIVVIINAFVTASNNRKVNAVQAVVTEVKTNVELIERNTNSIATRNEEIAKKIGLLEGEAVGRAAGAKEAEVLARGQRQGAAGLSSSAPTAPAPPPIPVEDERAAEINERVAVATEKAADAQEHMAKVAEEKPKPKSKG